MNKIICLLITMACGCAFGQTYQKLDKMDLRNTTSTANHSFTYNQDGVIYSKNSSGAQTGYWNAQTGEFDASLDGSDLDTGTIPVARLPIPAYVYEVAKSGKPYTTIASALAAATDPDVEKQILIHPGNYDENVTITIARTHLRGISRNAVVMHKTVSDVTAVIDVLADNCSIQDMTLSSTQTGGPPVYSRCVRVGTSGDPELNFHMVNCNLRGNGADELWVMTSVANCVIDGCEGSGTFDIFASSSYRALFKDCRLSASVESAFWSGVQDPYGEGNRMVIKDCYVDAPSIITIGNSVAILDNVMHPDPFGQTLLEDVPYLYKGSSGQTSSTLFSRNVTAKAGTVSGGGGTVHHYTLDPLMLNRPWPTYQVAATWPVEIQSPSGANADGSLRGGDAGDILIKGARGGDGNGDERSGDGGSVDIVASSAGTDNGGGLGTNGTLSLHGATIAVRGDTTTTGTYTGTNATVTTVTAQCQVMLCTKDGGDTVQNGDWLKWDGWDGTKPKVERLDTISRPCAGVAVAVSGNNVTVCIGGVCDAKVDADTIFGAFSPGMHVTPNSDGGVLHVGMPGPSATSNELILGTALEALGSGSGTIKVIVNGKGYQSN